LYLANDLVRAVVQNNDPARLRLLTAGTKLFSKQGSESSPEGQQFRILSEGVRVALPFIDPTQIVGSGNLAALKTLLQAYYPLCSSFSDPFRSDVEGRGK
jgi:multisite-specific tRNA:(cytosine-C5)-methyltransferase